MATAEEEKLGGVALEEWTEKKSKILISVNNNIYIVP
jgi:hypothetical protein